MKKLIAFSLVLCTAWSAAQAVGSLQARDPGTTTGYAPLWLKSMDARVTINDQIAVTFVDQTFVNTSTSRKEGIYTFTLPDGAVITELALWIGGTRQIATALPKAQATSSYDQSVRLTVDPALLTSLGNNVYQLNVYPLNAPPDSMSLRRIDFTYAVALNRTNDTSVYTFPLTTAGLTPQPPVRTTLTVTGRFQDTVPAVQAPGFPSGQVTLSRKDSLSFSLAYRVDSAYVSKDLAITMIGRHSPSFRCRTESYVPLQDTVMPFDSVGDASYFTMWLRSPFSASDSVKQREVIFAADASYSMSGAKLASLKASLIHAIGLLGNTDRFNIIAFNTGYSTFQPALVTATAEMRSAAVTYVNSLTAGGITDLIDPVVAALAGPWSTGTNRAVVLLSDGFPQWPLRMTEAAMIDSITAHNTQNVRIFSAGITSDIDQTFLSLLSQRNGGSGVILQAPDTAQGDLTAIVNQLRCPFVGNPALQFGTLDTADVHPSPLPQLAGGTQLAVYGRYTRAGRYPVVFSGNRDGTALLDTFQVTLPVPGYANSAIPQLWAAAKVDVLLDQIKVKGALPALTQAVTKLGVKYRIVTPYTSLLVLESHAGTGIIDKSEKWRIQKLELEAGYSTLSRKIIIKYAVPTDGTFKHIVLKLYNLRGEMVKVLADWSAPGGKYIVYWDGLSGARCALGSGCYLVVLEIDSKRLVRPLHIVR